MSSVAAGLSRGCWVNSHFGTVAVAMMTGRAMPAARTFSINSTPDTFGMELSVIKRS